MKKLIIFIILFFAISTINATYKPFIEDQKSAFGELLIAEPTPAVQLEFPYNINTEIVESRENNAGTITQASGMAVIQSGGSNNSAAHMLSKAPLRYGPGQGGLVRFTALFTTGVSGSIQLAGIGEVGDGFFFGYNAAAFSILRRESGKPEIQTLSITNGATTGPTGNITINLDSIAKTVAIVNGDTAREVAVKIADTDFKDIGLGWSADVNNATIIFKAWSDSDKAGTFSLVDTDGTGVVGAFVETVAGVSTTNNWTAQSSWSEDTFSAASPNPSGITLDPTKGNVYQIGYQWLGFGAIEFSIENPATGKFVIVHRIEYANANITPSLQNPTLPLHIMSKNTSNNSNLTIKTSSMAGFTEGRIVDLGIINAKVKNITNLGATEIPILTIKNKLVYQSTINRVRIEPLFVSFATLATKPIIFRIKVSPTLTGTPAFSDVSTDTSVMSFDTDATGITSGRELFTTILAKEDSEIIDFAKLRKMLNPGETFSITGQSTSGTNQEVTVSITWEELF